MFLGPNLWLFLLFGMLGMVGEVVFSAISSLIRQQSWKLEGHSYLWMLPIYGLIAFLFPLVNGLVASWPWWGRGLSYMVVIFVVEYISGALLKKITRGPVWHYTGRFNLHGHIQLTYAPVWFAVGLLVERYFNDMEQLCLWLAMHFG